MSAHTPGPWFYGISYEAEKGPMPHSYRGPGYYDNAGILAGDQTIIGCGEYDVFGPMNDAEREANTRLIATAPELLEALKGLHDDNADYLRLNNLGGYDNHWMVIARAAIAKALGK